MSNAHVVNPGSTYNEFTITTKRDPSHGWHVHVAVSSPTGKPLVLPQLADYEARDLAAALLDAIEDIERSRR